MAAKRPRQARENVTEIKSVGIEAANENSWPQDGFAPADNAGQPELEHAAAADAAEQILGANPLLGLDREELLAAGKRLLRLMTLNPQVLIEENLAFAREAARRSPWGVRKSPPIRATAASATPSGRRAVTTSGSCRASSRGATC